MIKYLLQTAFFICVCITGNGQTKSDKKYIERAAEVQQEVWNNADNAFSVKEIPAKYKNESAVIIAKSYDVSNSTKRKFKMIGMFGNTVKQYKYSTTYRERVLIQDKVALEDYSTLNYKKIVDNTSKIGFSKLLNTTKTYLGVKIFKQAGTVLEINPTEEEVLTKNTNKDKQGKLAVSNLQVGDIIDYYVRIEEVIEYETEVKGPDLFFLASEYPMMYYNVKYTLDKKCGADVMNLNGAKAMTELTNDDDDIILEFTEKDLPSVKSTFWTSQAREVPYYVVRYGFPGTSIVAKKGEVKRGPFTTKYKNIIKDYFISLIISRAVDKGPKKYIEKYFDDRMEPKDIPHDTLVNFLYNYYKWQQYKTFWNLDVSNARNYDNMDWYNMSVSFSEILRDFGVDNDIVIVCNRYSGRLNEIFGPADVETFVKVNGKGKLKWICFNDFFQDAGQLNADYQGEDALILTREGKNRNPKYEDSETPIKLPVEPSSENVSAEKLDVLFDKNNLQMIEIERFASRTGSMKQNGQKDLLLAEDIEAEFASLIGKKRTVEIISETKRNRPRAAEIQAAMDKERLNQQKYFKADIESEFGQEPKEMKAFKVVNAGLSLKKSAFEYSQTFTMENFVKKVGNNFIFDIGKLMGVYKKTDGKDRIRTQNVYMNNARSLSYSIAITLPEGYKAKGVDELNKKVENECASFVTTATIADNIVHLKITRTYNNNFELATNWDKLLAVMDAAADFSGAKLLLEKIK
jgi:hypothetical protein